MTEKEAYGQSFENGRKLGREEGYSRGLKEAYAEAGDLISVEGARKTAQRIFSDPVLIHAVDTTLNNTPAVAAKPVKHGRWLYNPGNPTPYCSCCGNNPNHDEETNYCPNCGTRMDGDSHV